MKKKIALTTLLLTAVMPLGTAFADDTTTTPDQSIATTQQQSVPEKEGRAQWEANRQQRDQNQTQRAQIRGEREQLNQQAQDNRQQNTQDRCQRIQQRLSDKVTQVQNNKQNFGIAFTNMKARLQRLSDRLASKNIDVAKLKADIETLGVKIDKLNQDHQAFLTNLETTMQDASQACGTSQGQFIGKLESARASSLAVEQDRLDIRNFFQNTIRPDIMTIRAEIEKQTNNDDEKTSISAKSNSSK